MPFVKHREMWSRSIFVFHSKLKVNLNIMHKKIMHTLYICVCVCVSILSLIYYHTVVLLMFWTVFYIFC